MRHKPSITTDELRILVANQDPSIYWNFFHRVRHQHGTPWSWPIDSPHTHRGVRQSDKPVVKDAYLHECEVTASDSKHAMAPNDDADW